MKIENKKVIIKREGFKDEPATYFAFIREALKKAPPQGFNYASLVAISDVLPFFDEDKSETELSRQSDIDFVKLKIEEFLFAYYADEFLVFQKYIKSLS